VEQEYEYQTQSEFQTETRASVDVIFFAHFAAHTWPYICVYIILRCNKFLPSDSSGGVATKAKMRKVKKSAAEFLFPLEMLEISGNKNSRLAAERSRELRTEKQRHPAPGLNPFVAEFRWVDPKENISTTQQYRPG